MLGPQPAHGQTSVETNILQSSMCFVLTVMSSCGVISPSSYTQCSIAWCMQVMTGPATDAAATVPPPAVAEATVAVAHPLPDSVAIAGMPICSCTPPSQYQNLHLVAFSTQLTGTRLTLLKCLGFDLEQHPGTTGQVL